MGSPNSSLLSSAISLHGQKGFILRGQFPGTFCFVPDRCATFDRAGKIHVQRSLYLSSTWARRNVRLNPGRTVGSHLFPEENGQPLDPYAPGIRHFLNDALTTLGQ